MKRISGLAVAVVLSACGGGGSGDAAISTNNSAEGFWSGTASTGDAVSFVVLENGETWGVSLSGQSLTGALYANLSTSGSTVSGTGSTYSFVSQTVGSGSFTGSVTSKATISLVSDNKATINATYDATYEQPALLTNLQGAYTGFAVGGATPAQSTTVVIDANGNLSSTFSSGSFVCATTGKATPRASGKNIFDIQLSFVGNACALGSGVTTTGVAALDTSTNQLIAMTLKADKSDGVMFIGKRP